MSHRLLLAFALVFCGATVSADVVQLKNGDRISGKILKLDAKEVIVETEFAGKITIKADAVSAISAPDTMTVTTKAGQVVRGPLETQQDALRVESKESGPITVPRADVVTVRNPAEQQRYEAELERFRNPGLLDLWSGFWDIGFSQTTGNAETFAFTMGANAMRATSRDKTTVTFTSIRANGFNQEERRRFRTANAIRGGLQYDINISKKMYGFGFTNLEFDEFQQLDLRFVGGGGLGYNVIKADKHRLELSAGGNVNREFFSTGLRRTTPELIFGQDYFREIGVFTLTEKLRFFPNLDQTGEYRFNFDASGAVRLRKWLALQSTFSNRYLSNPVPGVRKNDTLFTTGFRVSFAR